MGEKGLRCGCLVLWLTLLLRDRVLSSELDNKTCTSRCGIITNISYPFRLPHDPPHCGHPDYEVACENNVLLLHLQYYYDDDYYDLKNGTYRVVGTYRVLGINYNNFTIRIVDEGIQKGNCSSLPLHSLSLSTFSYYTMNPYSTSTRNSDNTESILNKQVGYLKCSDPVREDAALCCGWRLAGSPVSTSVSSETGDPHSPRMEISGAWGKNQVLR